jgi:Xaa-Pro aminopeptidase
MENYQKAQTFLKQENIDGWLLYYFDHNNPHALNFLQLLPTSHVSRRVFYWIPMQGEPVKIVHAIEENVLSHLPGTTLLYDSFSSLDKALKSVLSKAKRVAMEYSPCNSLPYISKVDAGTVEMVEKHSCKVVSSASFLLHFTSILSLQQIKMQQEAAKFLEKVAKQIFLELERALWKGQKISEYYVQQKILDYFGKEGFFTEYPPIIAFGKNSAMPHYRSGDQQLKLPTVVLIDIGVTCHDYASDMTRTLFLGAADPKLVEIYDIVKNTHDEVLKHVKPGVSVKFLDQLARECIKNYPILHSLGHGIGLEVHEYPRISIQLAQDVILQKNMVITIEPGVYIPGLGGVRLEDTIVVQEDGFKNFYSSLDLNVGAISFL